ncbi:hypothetical protein CDL15_Pgr027153 [Punica granatum]|uniref:Uncharacterized protein n=1 Tax=Punica granatum TaxID=22663 RepID=A0A218X9Q6_PUNGR|nr:hypothetical protein CDL15_Pgr027153 [Punica granatum]
MEQWSNDGLRGGRRVVGGDAAARAAPRGSQPTKQVKRSLVRVGVSARAAVQRDNLMIHRGENPRERKRPEKKRRAREVAVLGGMALGP